MENLLTIHRFTWRRAAVGVIGLVAGAALITPAVGHAAAALTKQKANKLYLGNTTIVSNTATLAPDTGQVISVLCPPGLQAVDGGFTGTTDTSGGFVEGYLPLESYPITAGARSVGWTSEAFNTGSSSTPATVQAVCSK
jgi:hypothetical protein